MASEEQVREIFTEIKSEFPLLPAGLVLASCRAETSFDSDQYYRHEPVYWRQYMKKDYDFWLALYKYQYETEENQLPEDPIELEKAVAEKYSASYGAMQVMYDIAVDLYFKRIVGNKSLYSAMDDFRRNKVISDDLFLELDLPEDLNDDENGVWYGCCEMQDKVKEIYKILCDIADKGQRFPKLTEFLSGKESFTFAGKKINLIDFFKFCLSGYQSGPGTIKKLLGVMKAERAFATWEDMKGYIPRVKSDENTALMIKHIEKAFEGADLNEFKLESPAA